MKLRQIEYVLAVAEEGSFTAAARRCHIVQSALSHQVAQLEQKLGTILFERNSRSLRLTPAGEAFVESGRRALDAVRRIEDEVAARSGEVRGRLSLGTISTLTEPDVIGLTAQFHRRYPHVDIEMSMDGSERMIDRMHEHSLDLAFVGLWPGVVIERLESADLCEEELVALLPREHPLTQCRRVGLEQLTEWPMADFGEGSGARQQSEEAFAAAGLRYAVRFEVSTISLLVDIVRRGLAIGLIPASLAPRLAGVCTRPVREAPRRVVRAVWHPNPTPATRAFLALLDL